MRRTSSATRTTSTIHKWLALVLAVPLLFWFGSGLFFAIAPIEQVRGEHVIAKPVPVAIPLDVAAAGLKRLAGIAGDKIEIKSLLDRPVAVVTIGKERPRLYELGTARLISPLPASDAIAIARRDLVGAPVPVNVAFVTTPSPTYRGVLPAWQVDFVTDTHRSIFVAADTGAVTARRSTLWRAYDFLWGLHILDLENREDFNTVSLTVVVALSLVLLITGMMLIPGRFGKMRLRKRR